ncbi:MAG TPA: hypothetical protein VFD58_02580 [Blastocatellia bacterium]|nr:hypothetical protein [Blastocatellia bacterium]
MKATALILSLCALTLPAVSHAQSRRHPSRPELIKAGQSVGKLRLGDTRERVLQLFPKKKSDEEYNYGPPCPRSEIHWLDFAREANGLFVYLKDGRVFQIQAETPRFSTAEGITADSPPGVVRRNYRNIETYVLMGSGSEAVGGRNLIYWVDRHQGIAFDFYYDRQLRKRYVKSVIVFEPGTEFQPEGCGADPQQWRKLKPFATEVPEKRGADAERRALGR